MSDHCLAGGYEFIHLVSGMREANADYERSGACLGLVSSLIVGVTPKWALLAPIRLAPFIKLGSPSGPC